MYSTKNPFKADTDQCVTSQASMFDHVSCSTFGDLQTSIQLEQLNIRVNINENINPKSRHDFVSNLGIYGYTSIVDGRKWRYNIPQFQKEPSPVIVGCNPVKPVLDAHFDHAPSCSISS